jgi:hypothetical protein
MDSFDLKQFLIENKLTENSKLNEARINPKLNIRQVKTELTKRIQKISTTGKYLYIEPYSIDVLTYFNGGADLYMVFLTDGEDIDETSEPEFESTSSSEVAQWLIDTAESTDPGKISQWIHLAENSKLNEARIVPSSTGMSRFRGPSEFTSEDNINFKWKNKPANPKSMLTDTESGEEFTKEEFWESDIIGIDPEFTFPNRGSRDSKGIWTLTFDYGEFSGFVNEKDFTF